MKTKVYYSIGNGGDGSVFVTWFESEELAKLDQEFMDEGWAEDCSGWITIEHEGPIKILDTVETVDSMIKDTKENIKEGYDEVYVKGMKKKLGVLMKLKNKG